MLLSLVFALAQDRAPVAGPPPSNDEKLLNGIYLIVNEQVVTQSEFFVEISRRGFLMTDEADRRRIALENHREFVKRMLMAQAGRDAGFPEDRIRSIVEDEVREMVEGQGGATGLGAALKQDSRDIEQFRAERIDYYYSLFWLYSVDGRNPGVSGRQHVDRWVSPSELQYLYRRQPAERIFPPTVRFQELVISVKAAGGGQKALDRMREIHMRALAGEDFGKLVAEHDSRAWMRNRRGLLDPIELDDALATWPELSGFIREGEAGTFSDPEPIRQGGELAGWRLVRLVERVERGSPEYQEAEVQQHLRALQQNATTEWRREVALNALYRAAYIWPTEAARPENAANSGAPTPGRSPASAPDSTERATSSPASQPAPQTPPVPESARPANPR